MVYLLWHRGLVLLPFQGLSVVLVHFLTSTMVYLIRGRCDTLTNQGGLPIKIWKVTFHTSRWFDCTSATQKAHKTLFKLSNQAVTIHYESRFCYCIAYFLPQNFQETHHSVLFSCNFRICNQAVFFCFVSLFVLIFFTVYPIALRGTLVRACS